jgi:hypothetical protein
MSGRQDLERFVAGVEEHLIAAAQRDGFSAPAWIPRAAGETLCVLRGEPFNLHVYLASGHGINMTVCVGPEFHGSWNPDTEVGLDWMCRALGLAGWDGARRYASFGERDAHLAELAARLPELVRSAKTRGAVLWPAVHALVWGEARPPRSWMDRLLGFLRKR